MDKAQERMDAEYNATFSMALLSPPLRPVSMAACAEGPKCAGLIDWGEESEEEDPTSGTCPVAYHHEDRTVVRLDAEDVHLGVDDAAWVPARIDPIAGTGPFFLGTNGFSLVRCVAGVWEDLQGLILVLNIQDTEVDLSKGDIVAYADATARTELGACARVPPPGPQDLPVSSTATASVAEVRTAVPLQPRVGSQASASRYFHILLDEPQLDYLFEVEMPPEGYYTAFRKWLSKMHPNADPFLLDHLESLEVLADVSIVSGFSFGVDKAVLAQPEVQYLGEREWVGWSE